MNQNNNVRPNHPALERCIESIRIQMRRIQTFFRNLSERSNLISRLEQLLGRRVPRFVVRTPNNFEQDIETFTIEVFHFLDSGWGRHSPVHLIRIANELDALAAFLRDVAPLLRQATDPQVEDAALAELLNGEIVYPNAGANDQQINLLRRVRAARLDEADNCTICLEAYAPGEELIQLPCGHVFHTLCVTGWLRQSAICPLDRETIFTRDNMDSASPSDP